MHLKLLQRVVNKVGSDRALSPSISRSKRAVINSRLHSEIEIIGSLRFALAIIARAESSAAGIAMATSKYGGLLRVVAEIWKFDDAQNACNFCTKIHKMSKVLITGFL